MKELIRDIPNHFDTRKPATVLGAEIALLENYKEPDNCLQWLAPQLQIYLEANEEFNVVTRSSVVYRRVLLPTPEALSNPVHRRKLREIILLHLHVHLWFGVVCGISFVDPRRVSVDEIAKSLNFLVLPESGIFRAGDPGLLSVIARHWDKRVVLCRAAIRCV
ncbi:MAG: hypothetical protein ACXVJ1_06855, partial [Candidatus Angelobacter sp.]